MNEIELTLNKRWKNACKVLFGQEIGDLKEYEGWLNGLIDKNTYRPSSISKKQVAYSIKEYSENSKWISFDEIDFSKKFTPLSINEIKDMDSLVGALSERFYYCGNVAIGNCSNIQKSTNMSDSHYINESAQYGDCKYLSHCTVGRLCDDCFGTHGGGESTFCLRSTQTYRDHRCFELWMCQNCSDCYYVYNLISCSDCIFSFSMRNKRHCIGNLPLEKTKYAQLKAKLLEEMVQKLKKDKQLPSLLDIAAKSRKEKPIMPLNPPAEEDLSHVKGKIEDEFTQTTKLLLGKGLTNIDSYGKWLNRHAHKIVEKKSAVSNKPLFFMPYTIAIAPMPDERIVTIEEADCIGQNNRLSAAEVESLTLGNAHEKLGKLAYFNVEFREGSNPNMLECTMSIDSSNCYRASATVYSKYCSYGMWPRSTQNAFGFDTLFDSSFCINSYHSVKLQRCFEMDTCRSCSDSYFCHNAENVQSSMFCFNTKNLKYAIGNAQLPPDKYKATKDALLSQIVQELEKKKDLKWSIYNLAGKA